MKSLILVFLVLAVLVTSEALECYDWCSVDCGGKLGVVTCPEFFEYCISLTVSDEKRKQYNPSAPPVEYKQCGNKDDRWAIQVAKEMGGVFYACKTDLCNKGHKP